jgi:hypothetical protein
MNVESRDAGTKIPGFVFLADGKPRGCRAAAAAD